MFCTWNVYKKTDVFSPVPVGRWKNPFKWNDSYKFNPLVGYLLEVCVEIIGTTHLQNFLVNFCDLLKEGYAES